MTAKVLEALRNQGAESAAYGSLLRSRRQELHACVAAGAATQLELLAHHLTGAAEAERAVDHWLTAGQFAAARFA